MRVHRHHGVGGGRLVVPLRRSDNKQVREVRRRRHQPRVGRDDRFGVDDEVVGVHGDEPRAVERRHQRVPDAQRAGGLHLHVGAVADRRDVVAVVHPEDGVIHFDSTLDDGDAAGRILTLGDVVGEGAVGDLHLVRGVREVDDQRAGAVYSFRLIAEAVGVANEDAVVEHRAAGRASERYNAAAPSPIRLADRAAVAREAAVLDGNRGVFGPDGGAAPIVAHPAAGSRRSQGRVAVGHEERIVYHRAGEGGHVDAEAAVGVVLGRVDVAGEGAVGDDERPHAAAPHVHTAAVDGADVPAVALDDAAGDLERADAGLDEAVLAGLVELDPFNLEVGARQWILDLQQAVRRVRAVEDG